MWLQLFLWGPRAESGSSASGFGFVFLRGFSGLIPQAVCQR